MEFGKGSSFGGDKEGTWKSADFRETWLVLGETKRKSTGF